MSTTLDVGKWLVDTAMSNGGATLWTSSDEKNSGFMVSLAGIERCITLGLCSNERLYAEARMYIASNFYRGDSVGAWIHEGRLYLDVSNHYEDYESALDSALKNKQIAIYDLGSQQSVMALNPAIAA